MTMVMAGASALTIKLEDGVAEYIGDTFAVFQRDHEARRASMQNVILNLEDLEALRSAIGAPVVALEDGEAHDMGDGLFVILQADRATRGHPIQSVVISANDAEAMLALAA